MPTEECSISTVNTPFPKVPGIARCPKEPVVYCVASHGLLCWDHAHLHFAKLDCAPSDHVLHHVGQLHQ